MSLPLNPGTRLGSYEIICSLGAGAMGEVWKARDTRLGRLVAIKTSLKPFNVRFEREARAIAAVNHPHVCSIFDVGPDYIVMEYVEGESLRGPMPLSRALELAEQIVEALAAAHEQGIIHRDLKPDNILLTKTGVKVLDFGLAKFDDGPAVANRNEMETVSASLTSEGTLVGTLPYMSPEQVEGREADKRSDIFAFGVVLYELIAGTRPFKGKTQAGLITSILSEVPPSLAEIDSRTPRLLAELVRTCLEKDPDKRWQSARDLKHALRWMTVDTPPALSTKPSTRLWQGFAILLAAILLGAGVWVYQRTGPGSPVRVEASGPENATLADVSISPDGRKLAFTAGAPDELWLRDIDALTWRRVPGTEGASSPFWSPDSRYVGFVVDNTIRKIDTRGGPSETVSSIPAAPLWSGAWSHNGELLVGSWGGGSGGPLWRVSSGGGAAIAVTEVDVSKGEFVHTSPSFLPDGKHFLYFRSGPPDIQGIYVGSLDVDARSQSRKRILATDVPAIFAAGYIFFLRAGTLIAQPFDARRQELQDHPVPIAENVATTWYSTGVFSVGEGGALVYRTASESRKVQLSWLDRRGNTVSTFGPPGTDIRVVLSPDGKRAISKDTPYGVPGDLWILDFASGRRTRFTFSKNVYSPGVWSPDGTHVAYSAGRFGDTILQKAASGLGDEEVLLSEPGLRHFPTSWSHDGRFLLYHTENAVNTGYDVWALSLSDRSRHLLLGETFNEWAAVFSPDMRWIAYVGLETGAASQVFVRPFQVSVQTGLPSVGNGKWQVSKEYGNWPQWRIDREIVFSTAPIAANVFAAPVYGNNGSFESGMPERLPFPQSTAVGNTPQSTSDGRRFLVEVPLNEPAARTSANVVLNWQALVKR